jgi:hypothetical protein
MIGLFEMAAGRLLADFLSTLHWYRFGAVVEFLVGEKGRGNDKCGDPSLRSGRRHMAIQKVFGCW